MNTADYVAIEGNALITDDDEILLRQVHPSFMTPDGPSKQAFEATAEHNFLLSTKRERVGAETACREHRAIPRASVGTWGLTVGDARGAQTPAVDDEHTVAPDHASLSFLDLQSQGQRQRSARKLRDSASCLYRAQEDS